MTFLFPESISTSTKIQPKEKLFNLQNLHVIRAQNPLVSTRFFIACKLYITMNGRVFITLMLDLSFSKINRPLDFQSLQDSSDDKELYHCPFLFFRFIELATFDISTFCHGSEAFRTNFHIWCCFLCTQVSFGN